jgi:hypothetical protein
LNNPAYKRSLRAGSLCLTGSELPEGAEVSGNGTRSEDELTSNSLQAALEAEGLVRSEWTHRSSFYFQSRSDSSTKALSSRRPLAVKKDTTAETPRDILERKLNGLTLLAKKLCREARVEAHTVRYEDEDGRLKIFPPPGLLRSSTKLVFS